MKIGSWLGAVSRNRQRLNELKPRLLCLQFGGASGTLASLGDHALPVAHALAEELQLQLPDQPWHTQRDRLVEFGAVLGLIATVVLFRGNSHQLRTARSAVASNA